MVSYSTGCIKGMVSNKKFTKNRLVEGWGINDSDSPVSIKVVNKDGTVTVRRCSIYTCWRNMIKRAKSNSYKELHPSYLSVTVCSEWRYFSNFKKWVNSNNLTDLNGLCLDKDIISKENKIYCPENCIFIDQSLNKFLTNIEHKEGRGLPTGVHRNGRNFAAYCSDPTGNFKNYIGTFETIKQAHVAWAQRKLEIAKIIASEQTDERVVKSLVEKFEKILKVARDM